MKKLALIGGGGVRTIFFSQSLAKYAQRLDVGALSIMDIDETKLGIYGEMAKRIMESSGAHLDITLTTDIKEAATDADYVVTTMRVGGDEGRVRDERIALSHGVLGQETTGPGGFSYALRTIPVMKEYCEYFEKYGNAPLVFNFTNPSGLVTQALYDDGFTRIIGICDSPTELKKDVAKNLGLKMRQLSTKVYGLNHLSWMNSVEIGGKEVLPALLGQDAFLENSREFGHFDKALIRHIGAVPNEYLYYYYYRDEAVANILNAGQTRGEVIRGINRRMNDMLFELDPAENPDKALEAYYGFIKEREDSYMSIELQSRRRDNEKFDLSKLGIEIPDDNAADDQMLEGYSGVMFNYIDALNSNIPAEIVLNVPSEGAVPGLADSDIAELTCVVDAGGAKPVAAHDVPVQNILLMQQVKLYEKLTVRAVSEKSRQLCIEALFQHPLVGSYALAKTLVEEYLAAFKDELGEYR